MLIYFVRIDQSNIYSWDSRNCDKNSLLLSKYWLKYTKLVGFKRFISYISSYLFLLALFVFFFLLSQNLSGSHPTHTTIRSRKTRHRLKEEDVWRLFVNLQKFCKKMFLDIFKLFPSRFRDATTPYFHPIEKHRCHQSVENIFLEDPTYA